MPMPEHLKITANPNEAFSREKDELFKLEILVYFIKITIRFVNLYYFSHNLQIKQIMHDCRIRTSLQPRHTHIDLHSRNSAMSSPGNPVRSRIQHARASRQWIQFPFVLLCLSSLTASHSVFTGRRRCFRCAFLSYISVAREFPRRTIERHHAWKPRTSRWSAERQLGRAVYGEIGRDDTESSLTSRACTVLFIIRSHGNTTWPIRVFTVDSINFRLTDRNLIFILLFWNLYPEVVLSISAHLAMHIKRCLLDVF